MTTLCPTEAELQTDRELFYAMMTAHGDNNMALYEFLKERYYITNKHIRDYWMEQGRLAYSRKAI